MVLLLLCLITTAFGCLFIASATNASGFTRFLVIQIVAAGIGVFLFAVFSSIDASVFAEQRMWLFLFSLFMLLLIIPFGTDNGSGNKSWLDIPLVPVNIQPAEICKITYILITASVMNIHQNKPSSIPAVFHLVFYLGAIVGLNMILSKDAGVSLIFVFIFIGMAFAGGISLIWFLIGGGALAALIPIAWPHLDEYQQLRIMILFDPSLDAEGWGARYHTAQSLLSLTGGGFSGQGLFQGSRTQADLLFAQHTDYIFSTIGEEAGFVGCFMAIILMIAIIARCIYVGRSTPDYLRRMICYGAASALIFQVFSNIGMCIGITPVIGLTLPFISYGGSSIVSLYAMLGLVSGVYARPTSSVHEIYVSPY